MHNLMNGWKGGFVVALLLSVCGQAQVAPQITEPPAAPAAPLPSGGNQAGNVDTTASVTNAGGGQSVPLLDSRVNPTGPFQGSVPEGTASSGVMKLSLADAVALGLRRNLGSYDAQSALRAAEGRRETVRSELLPHADGLLYSTDKQAAPLMLDFQPPTYARVAGPYHFFDLGAALNQVVFDLTRRDNLKAVTAELQAAGFDIRNARDLIVLAVCGEYLQVNADYSRVEAAQSRLRTAQRIYQQAQDQLQAGVLDTLNANRSRVQLQVEQLRLRSLQVDYDTQRLTLTRLIGIPAAQRVVLGDEFVFHPLEYPDLTQAIAEALRQRQDLKAARARLQAAVFARAAAKAQYKPTLDVQATYDVVGDAPSHSNGFYGVAGQVNFPVFEYFRIKGQVKKADAAVQLRTAEIADLQGQVDFEIRRVFLQLDAATDQVAVAASNLDLAHQTLRQSEERLEAGVADTVELVQAQQQVAQADDDYISAVFTHNLSKVVLSRSLGQADVHIQAFLQKK